MACRRRRQLSLPDGNDRHAPGNMDQLAFKYMVRPAGFLPSPSQEMCKVESSTDSDSEISPRWSDTSTVGCVSSAPESRTIRRTVPLAHKPSQRHGCFYSLFLDPYDGSSEDSDDTGASSRRARQQGKGGGGGSWASSRSRRFNLHHPASVALRDVVKNGTRDTVTGQQHLVDVQMRCGSEPELWGCELDVVPSHSDTEAASDSKMQTKDTELHGQFDDSGLHTTRSSTPQTPRPGTPAEVSSSQMLETSSDRPPSPCALRSLYKRKLGFPGAEVMEQWQRKRQCVVNMEDQQEGGDSASNSGLTD